MQIHISSSGISFEFEGLKYMLNGELVFSSSYGSKDGYFLAYPNSLHSRDSEMHISKDRECEILRQLFLEIEKLNLVRVVVAQ